MNRSEQNTLVDNKDWKYAVVVFLLWPVASLALATFSHRSKAFRVLAILFSALIGYTFYYKVQGSDSLVYADTFKSWSNKSFDDILSVLISVYSPESGVVDFTLQIIYFTVSRFTDDVHFFFMTLSVIFGSMLLNILVIFQKKFQEFNRITLLGVLLFFVLVPIFYINHFRWYFALLLFVSGISSFFLLNRRFWWMYIIASLFTHFSFVAPILGLIVYLVVGVKNWIYYPVVILSFFISANIVKQAGDGGLIESTAYNTKVQSYTAERYMDQVEADATSKIAIIRFNDMFTKFGLLFIGVFVNLKNDTRLGKERGLFSLGLLILSITNFGSQIQTFGSRFSVLFNIIMLLYIIVFSSRTYKDDFLSRFIYFLLLLIIASNLLVKGRYGLEYLSPESFLPFTPISLLFNYDTNILDFLK